MKGLALGLALKQEKGNVKWVRGVAWSRVEARGVALCTLSFHFIENLLKNFVAPKNSP